MSFLSHCYHQKRYRCFYLLIVYMFDVLLPILGEMMIQLEFFPLPCNQTFALVALMVTRNLPQPVASNELQGDVWSLSGIDAAEFGQDPGRQAVNGYPAMGGVEAGRDRLTAGGIGATSQVKPHQTPPIHGNCLRCRFEKWRILYRFCIFDACSRVLQFGDALQFEEPQSIVDVVSLDRSDKIEMEII